MEELRGLTEIITLSLRIEERVHDPSNSYLIEYEDVYADDKWLLDGTIKIRSSLHLLKDKFKDPQLFDAILQEGTFSDLDKYKGNALDKELEKLSTRLEDIVKPTEYMDQDSWVECMKEVFNLFSSIFLILSENVIDLHILLCRVMIRSRQLPTRNESETKDRITTDLKEAIKIGIKDDVYENARKMHKEDLDIFFDQEYYGEEYKPDSEKLSLANTARTKKMIVNVNKVHTVLPSYEIFIYSKYLAFATF